MKLKSYNNLYHLYRMGRRKFFVPFWISLAIFILAFATIMIDGFPFGATLIMMAMIFPAILFGVLWMITSIRTKKHLKRLTPEQLHRIDKEIPSCEIYEGLLVTSQEIVGNKLGLVILPIANALWVYTWVEEGTLEGIIPIYKSTKLIIAGRDHKQYGFKIKNNQNAYHFIKKELLKRRLDLVFGYERGMEDIYKNDINRLIAFSMECAEKRQKGMEV